VTSKFDKSLPALVLIAMCRGSRLAWVPYFTWQVVHLDVTSRDWSPKARLAVEGLPRGIVDGKQVKLIDTRLAGVL